MIHLSGLVVRDESNPEGDIEIIYTGLRPGEKLYEELLIGENVLPTRHSLISTANEDCLSWDELVGFIHQFEETTDSHDVERSRALLVDSVKGFAPQCDVADLVQLKQGAWPADKIEPGSNVPYPG
jgi:FlaA1/EpsC-like NDP-sugar epimerase